MAQALRPSASLNKRVVTRLRPEVGDTRWPWKVYVDGKLAHKDGSRASAWDWASRERVRIAREK